MRDELTSSWFHSISFKKRSVSRMMLWFHCAFLISFFVYIYVDIYIFIHTLSAKQISLSGTVKSWNELNRDAIWKTAKQKDVNTFHPSEKVEKRKSRRSSQRSAPDSTLGSIGSTVWETVKLRDLTGETFAQNNQFYFLLRVFSHL